MRLIRISPLYNWAKIKAVAAGKGNQRMRKFARWHIWLAWLTGIPILMWTITGLVMVSKPIEEVRGNHLRTEQVEAALPADTNIAISLPADGTGPVRSTTTTMQGGNPVTTIDYMDGSVERFASDGSQIAPLDSEGARAVVAKQIVGGDQVVGATFFKSDEIPFDFRRPMPVWQVELADGAHIYVGRDTGDIEAVRTRWWRIFDVMWGLHIMDLEEREDTSHPILILFAALAVLGSLLGTILMFRRRKARIKVPRATNA